MSTRSWTRRSVLDRAPGAGVPNMTPMVDVTLVILIFFMASATIAGPEWFLRAALPGPAPSGVLALPSPVVRAEVFVRDGQAWVAGLGDDRSIDDAVGAVRGLDDSTARGLVVELDARDDAPYAAVVRLHSELVARGAEVRLR